ncbi:ATP-grasp domain-containing protein [Streptomyces sp. NPDC015131]|uniref:ATP-grasp domain-containing protein n=1 Tax=Streptomyces sp. NPDC015131 TaxID=3364941 RepID=UPI0036FEAE36
MGATFIHCADPLRPGRPDGHFADEARTARDQGRPTALIDHDALEADDPGRAVSRVPEGLGPAWYRGWMVTSEQYTALDAALAARGVTLLTAPDAYRRAHELPGWYDTFASVTPRSVWLPTEPGSAPSPERLSAAARPLGGGPAVLKDYVKSRKHEWDEACFVPDLADARRLARTAARLVERQGDGLAGGVVVRAFEDYRTAVGEARVWWVDGDPVLVTPHPDSPGLRPRPDPGPLRPLVAALGCRFVTTDMALRQDGAWRVVEVGDGQVSDLPRGTDPAPLLRSLAAADTPR